MFTCTKNQFECSPGTKNWNEGTFGCSPAPNTGTRAHSPKPPLFETALLFPLNFGPLGLDFGTTKTCTKIAGAPKLRVLTYPELAILKPIGFDTLVCCSEFSGENEGFMPDRNLGTKSTQTLFWTCREPFGSWTSAPKIMDIRTRKCVFLRPRWWEGETL